ncbi:MULTISPECIES: Fur family transcriptional regulator [Halomonadaceae]|uniref:Ferric uptake regulation protein n=1 Tax=Vreelandella halophila TaxID=86177 RepID=A0A9X4YA19_9GAMM|nr:MULTISPECIES: Fur family transcriptional regulator [Halomonas]MYL25969.1 transcriptional repressor [Halomonas utahensis]MYL73469.1 transcriptional repressor [Halomonas sp. 22501_18_FS]
MTHPLPYRSHDHEACVSQALSDARRICAEKGARLTRLREQVLELVWQSHRPLGAYDILDILNGEGRRSAPPTVYRTLDFLLQMGLVHRIASLNAFVGCNQPDHHHTGCFLICRQCHNVLEIEASGIQKAIDSEARSHGFLNEETVAEVTGLCPACREEDGHD